MKNGKKKSSGHVHRNGNGNGNGRSVEITLSPDLIRQAMLDKGHVPESPPKQNGSALIFRCAKCHALACAEGGTWFGTAFDHFCYPGSVDKRLERQPWTEADQKARDERLKKERAERIAAKRLP